MAPVWLCEEANPQASGLKEKLGDDTFGLGAFRAQSMLAISHPYFFPDAIYVTFQEAEGSYI